MRDGAAHLADLIAHHQRGDFPGALRAGIDGRGPSARAQDRARSGRDGAPLRACAKCRGSGTPSAEIVERDEQVLGLLRRQHGGRLVEDEQARTLQQAADDFDALPLAGRERPDRAVGIEREAVVAEMSREALRHASSVHSSDSATRDVLRDRQLVEQREVLEHHADAERPRLDRRARW